MLKGLPDPSWAFVQQTRTVKKNDFAIENKFIFLLFEFLLVSFFPVATDLSNDKPSLFVCFVFHLVLSFYHCMLVCSTPMSLVDSDSIK